MTPDPLDTLPPDALVLGCAGCGVTMAGPSEPRAFDGVPRFGGRLAGRPYCAGCVRVRRLRPGRPEPAGPSPWQENAVRAMEGD